jgi:hypothetical protein
VWTSELVARFRELRGGVQAPPGLSAAASLAEEAASATAATAAAATAATDAATSADAGAGAAAAMPPAPGGAADAPAAAAADAATHADADATVVRPAKRAKLEGTRAERGRGGSMFPVSLFSKIQYIQVYHLLSPSLSPFHHSFHLSSLILIRRA